MSGVLFTLALPRSGVGRPTYVNPLGASPPRASARRLPATHIGAANFAELLVSGGDSRLCLDAAEGRNVYFCPPMPCEDLAAFASCTASPISPEGWEAARCMLGWLDAGADPAAAARALGEELAGLLGVDDLAEVLLTASGTDSAALVSALLRAGTPPALRGRPITHVMMAAAETGSGMPGAAGERVVHVALRDAAGMPRPSHEIDDDVAILCARHARPVLHLLVGSKTGLEAPCYFPPGVEVVVDACQGRLAPERLRGFLRRGWPVMITGSKFYGGPAFAGALLWPRGRALPVLAKPVPHTLVGMARGAPIRGGALGPLLRWAAALEEIRLFARRPLTEQLSRVAALSARIERWINDQPLLQPIDSRMPPGGWPRSIISFAVRRPDGSLMDMAALRRVQARLVEAGVLLGQPVAVSADFGALRVAIGARTLRDGSTEVKLQRLFAALASPLLLAAD